LVGQFGLFGELSLDEGALFDGQSASFVLRAVAGGGRRRAFEGAELRSMTIWR